MAAALDIVEIERTGDTLVVTPQRNLRELEFQEIEEEMTGVLHTFEDDPSVRNVVVDFGRTDLFGSTALGLFLRLRRRVRDREGRMAFCNVSPHEKEILAVTALGEFWPAYASRQEAIAAMAG